MEIRQAMRRFMPARAKTDKAGRADEQKVVLGAYYDALASSGLYSSYRTRPWPVERAVAEAYERVVWIYKAVEAISSAASQLTFQLKQGEDVVEDHPLYRVLNKKANPLETGRQFRKRLSAQILLSKKGAFVEITRSRGGDIIRMDLLPPGRTTPVPGIGEVLLDHYQVLRVDGSRYEIPPENVRWFREPHPLDPYCGVTPLEAAGMSIELDFFARLYNVAFLKNDARPGGVLAVNGAMAEEEMDRIESRFAKGAPNAGNLSVINGEVSYIDLSAQPRDMQYETTSSISKKEILSAFGVPESVIGDASGRTWDNAEQELYNYWTIAMPPHLNLLATGLDEDSEDNFEGGFDLSKIEVLQRAAIARRAEAREEFDKGLICADEYRDRAGYKLIENEHSRSLYMPAGRTAIATNEADAKKLKDAETEKLEAAKPQLPPGAPPQRAIEAAKKPGQSEKPGASAKPTEKRPARERAPQGRAKAYSVTLPPLRIPRPREVKAAPAARESAPDAEAHARLEAALETALAALMIRLTARAATRLSSPKARKHTRHWEAQYDTDTRMGTKALNAEQAVDPARWEEETEQTVRPLIEDAAMVAAAALLADFAIGGFAPPVGFAAPRGAGRAAQSLTAEAVSKVVAGVVALLRTSAARQAARLVEVIDQDDQAGQAMGAIALTVRSYAKKMASWARGVAVQAATATINGARDAAAVQLVDEDPDRDTDTPRPPDVDQPEGVPERTIERIWRHRGDKHVRNTHHFAGGQIKPLGEPFRVGESLLRYPGDPDGPPEEVYNCRCWLIHRAVATGRFIPTPSGQVTRAPKRKDLYTQEWSTSGLTLTSTKRASLTQELKRGKFDESQVRRDDDGQFADKPGGAAGNGPPEGRHGQGQTRSNSSTSGSSAFTTARRTNLEQWDDSDWTSLSDQAQSPDRDSTKDETLGTIYAKQGFDGKPEIGDVGAAVAAGGLEIFRGFGGADGEQRREQLRTGDYYPGLGMYGNGTYASTGREEAEAYSRFPPLRMALRPEAKVIGYEELNELMTDTVNNSLLQYVQLPPEEKTPEKMKALKDQAVVIGDPGRLAALLGYDAIRVSRFSSDHEYVVVLNRTALVVE